MHYNITTLQIIFNWSMKIRLIAWCIFFLCAIQFPMNCITKSSVINYVSFSSLSLQNELSHEVKCNHTPFNFQSLPNKLNQFSNEIHQKLSVITSHLMPNHFPIDIHQKLNVITSYLIPINVIWHPIAFQSIYIKN